MSLFGIIGSIFENVADSADFKISRLYGIAQSTAPGPKYRHTVGKKRIGIFEYLVTLYIHSGNKTSK